jgi:hypothetical protein
MAASYRVNLNHGEYDSQHELTAETVGEAVLLAANAASFHDRPKPVAVTVKVLVRRPGAESWIGCYVSDAILKLL